ncbi:MAG: LPS assembly protein LptD [Methylococcaceae bacterium]
MFFRLLLIFLPTLPVIAHAAEQSAWQCGQDPEKGWVCAGNKAAISPKIEPPTVLEQTAIPEQKLPVAVTSPEPATINTPTSAVINNPPPVLPADNQTSNNEDIAQNKPAYINTGVLESFRFNLFKPAFDNGQETIFNDLNNRFKTDPWQNCTLPSNTKTAVIINTKNTRKAAPLDVESNYSEIFDNEIGNYSGKVKMKHADQQAQSDSAHYDSVSETLNLQGGVYYSEDDLAFYSNAATLQLASDQAKLRDTLFIMPSLPLRGSAKAIYRDNKVLSRYKDVAYTSCKPNNQDWVIHAEELKVNKESGKGAAKNAWLEFKGLPLFYAPYLSFPVDNRRLSGFLAPAYNYTQNSGLGLSMPYYWNIAPNYDATLTPHYLDKRGFLLGTNFRYLTEHTLNAVSVDYMPDDTILNKQRYRAALKNTSQFSQHLTANMDLNYVSDKNYYVDLGNALSFSNFSFVKSSADINYVNKGISFTSRMENYQTVDQTLTGKLIPYRRLPQLTLKLDHTFKSFPLQTAVDTDYVYFQHDQLVNGQRLNVKPSITVPLQSASGFFIPKVSLQHSEYLLNNPNGTQANDMSRTLPIVSVDSGLFGENELNFGGTNYTHTVEPRLFYLYIPRVKQNNIPVFDSSLYDFWYSNLFRENRFSGMDRIQDANQITAAISSRLIDSKTGKERLKLSIGEIFYFQDRNVTVPVLNKQGEFVNTAKETNKYSNLVTEVSSQLSDYLSLEAGLQWNPQSQDIQRGKAVLHLHDDNNKLLNLGYLYRKNPLIPDKSNDIAQTDVSFSVPVYDNWSLVGRWQYSLLYNLTQEAFFGLEKENCCWRFRVIGRRYINGINNSTITTNPNELAQGISQTGIFFQIELKGLTGVGEKLDSFFEKSIYGYQKIDK